MNLRAIIRLSLPAILSAAAFVGSAPSAHADFQVCNSTSSRVGVSVGYKDGEAWSTEGWWNIPANSCETLMRGDLVARYYYIHAIDYDNQNEAWDGPVPMCIRDSEFTIKGIDNCLARGFERKGFFEVDTGENRTWTVQLTATSAATQNSSSAASPQEQKISPPTQ